MRTLTDTPTLIDDSLNGRHRMLTVWSNFYAGTRGSSGS